MSEDRPILYLIAHKVRGEPAFDIATPLQIGEEEGWIIPTSGHRAYPYAHVELEWAVKGTNTLDLLDPSNCPPTLPDHYCISASPRTANPAATRDLLSSLGLLKPAEPIKRRI